MPNAPGPETVECQTCGSDIRKHASICHQCGTENELKPGRSKREEGVLDALPSVGILRPKSPQNVTGQWLYGVIITLLLWILVFGLTSANFENSFVGLLMIVAWIGLPLSIYYDSHYVYAKEDWTPTTGLWCLMAAVPLLNIPVGALYLLRRRENIQE